MTPPHDLPRSPWGLCHGVFRMLPDFRRPKAQHDVVFRDTSLDQLFGNPVFRAIALNPEFVVENVNVDQTAVHALPVIPSHIHQQVTVMGPVKDRLRLNLPVRIRNLRVCREDGLNNLPIRV
jgi:hypothetical protein